MINTEKRVDDFLAILRAEMIKSLEIDKNAYVGVLVEDKAQPDIFLLGAELSDLGEIGLHEPYYYKRTFKIEILKNGK